MHLCVSLFLMATVVVVAVWCEETWFYLPEGGSKPWGGICDSGAAQSPIDIITRKAVNTAYDPLQFRNYHYYQLNVLMINTGHTITLGEFSSAAELFGGPLGDDVYVIDEIEFHWPSEHTMNGEHFPLEIQMTHRNKKYPDWDSANQNSDGAVVISVLFYLSAERNRFIQKIVNELDEVKQYSNIRKPVAIKQSFQLDEIMESKEFYYTYSGSKTTPPCTENRRYIILRDKVPIHWKQVNRLKEIEFKPAETLKSNYRNTQHLGSRTVIVVETEINEHAAHWSYPNLLKDEEFPKWGGVCDTGQLQSPIDLTYDDKKTRIQLPPFVFKNYDLLACGLEIINNGHTLKVQGFQDVTVSGGPFGEDFILDSVHFHWQSEHTFDFGYYPLETHFVHYASSHGSLEVAAGRRYGLAVLALVHYISARASEPISHITEQIDDVAKYTNINKPVLLRTALNLSNFFSDTTNYFTYFGSLTTPPCTEYVRWIVFVFNAPVSYDQISKFRELQSERNKRIKNNYREIQDTNNRFVYFVTPPSRKKSLGRSESGCINLKANSMIYLFLIVVMYVG